MEHLICNASPREPWNKGKLVGQKTPLKLKNIWALRVRLELSARTRDLALFDLAIDSKWRACDLVKLRVRDVSHGEHMAARAIVMQQKTQRPVQFEITEQTRDEEPVVRALGRLMKEGLSRHDGVHAIGSRVAEQIYDILKVKDAPEVSNARYYAAIERLTAAGWRNGDG